MPHNPAKNQQFRDRRLMLSLAKNPTGVLGQMAREWLRKNSEPANYVDFKEVASGRSDRYEVGCEKW